MFSDPVLSYRRIEKELKRMQIFSKYVKLHNTKKINFPKNEFNAYKILKIIAME
jgi:hypothetical protein